jgi:class 3 adenylate cyclase
LQFAKKIETLISKSLTRWEFYTPQKIEIGLGCGIHTGDSLVGNVGTDFRDQFTALGPHVNFASRIEARAEASQILISQSTQARVAPEFNLAPAGEIDNVKNITGKFALYTVDSERAQRTAGRKHRVHN